MAGEATRNLGSNQYRGDLPDVFPSGNLTWVIGPNAAFIDSIKEMRAAGVEDPIACPEQDQDAVLVARATWTIPLRSTNEWPQSHVIMGEVARMPLIEFKKRHKAQFEAHGHAGLAASIVIPDEKKIEV